MSAVSEFSFQQLDQRIEALPEGPVASLNRPRWIVYSDLAGIVGLIAGFLPSVFILFWEPQMWMADMAKVGVIVAYVGFAPGFLHSTWKVVSSFRYWRKEQTEQLDHDYGHFQLLCEWVASHPREVVAKHLRFAQMARTRLTSKMGLLAGGADRLGVLPLLVALAIQAKAAVDISAIPLWQLVLGLFATVTYLVAMLASLMRLRLQLYEFVLTEALGERVHQSGA